MLTFPILLVLELVRNHHLGAPQSSRLAQTEPIRYHRGVVARRRFRLRSIELMRARARGG